jgi:virulence-associated protein VagC
MKTTKLFKIGESQAVRLPKEKPWGALVDSLTQFSSDFMTKRAQPMKNDRRESL